MCLLKRRDAQKREEKKKNRRRTQISSISTAATTTDNSQANMARPSCLSNDRSIVLTIVMTLMIFTALFGRSFRSKGVVPVRRIRCSRYHAWIYQCDLNHLTLNQRFSLTIFSFKRGKSENEAIWALSRDLRISAFQFQTTFSLSELDEIRRVHFRSRTKIEELARSRCSTPRSSFEASNWYFLLHRNKPMPRFSLTIRDARWMW